MLPAVRPVVHDGRGHWHPGAWEDDSHPNDLGHRSSARASDRGTELWGPLGMYFFRDFRVFEGGKLETLDDFYNLYHDLEGRELFFWDCRSINAVRTHRNLTIFHHTALQLPDLVRCGFPSRNAQPHPRFDVSVPGHRFHSCGFLEQKWRWAGSGWIFRGEINGTGGDVFFRCDSWLDLTPNLVIHNISYSIFVSLGLNPHDSNRISTFATRCPHLCSVRSHYCNSPTLAGSSPHFHWWLSPHQPPFFSGEIIKCYHFCWLCHHFSQWSANWCKRKASGNHGFRVS